MIGTHRILATLRQTRQVIGALLAPLLVFGFLASNLGGVHIAKARAFDDLIAQSRCLVDTGLMPAEKAPMRPDKTRPCPSCTTQCTTGCCTGPMLSGGSFALAARWNLAGLDIADQRKAVLTVPRQFASSVHAQAPPYPSTLQSIRA